MRLPCAVCVMAAAGAVCECLVAGAPCQSGSCWQAVLRVCATLRLAMHRLL